MEQEIKLFLIDYTINIGEEYVGVAAVSATSPTKAEIIFKLDSAFNGYEQKLKITSIKEIPASAIPNLDVEKYMSNNAVEVLRLNDIIVADGKSAYLIAVENGFKGTEQEWLNSLHGKDGEDGLSGNINYPTFSINDRMHLIMHASAASDKDRFYINENGNLILVI